MERETSPVQVVLVGPRSASPLMILDLKTGSETWGF